MMQAAENYIVFADAEVEAICVAKWGTDGKLTYKQAAAVTTFNNGSGASVWKDNTDIVSFDELRFFTGLQNYCIFTGCSSLESVMLPEQLTRIENSAFSGCAKLSGVTLPDAVASIGQNAFYGCSALTSINLGNIVTLSSYAAFRRSALAGQLSAPRLQGAMPGQSFYGCPVTSVESLGSVTSLGSKEFSYCNQMISIRIPSTVTSLGLNSVFTNNSSLEVTCLAATPPSYNSVFHNGYVKAIYVPSASVDAYKAASGWSGFASVIQAIPS